LHGTTHAISQSGAGTVVSAHGHHLSRPRLHLGRRTAHPGLPPLTPPQWGWVTGIFTLAYALFEIPTGLLGDRIGARRVLTRIVLWWSVFTTFTGMVPGFYSMLATRFLFGAGEAGAYPNISVVIARWFPIEERGRA